MRKAISPIVSVVILVVISISLAAMIAAWMYDIVTSTTNQTQQDAALQLKCRKAGLDFDSGYGNNGVLWNFTGNGSDWLSAKVVNTGSVDLHGFSFGIFIVAQPKRGSTWNTDPPAVFVSEGIIFFLQLPMLVMMKKAQIPIPTPQMTFPNHSGKGFVPMGMNPPMSLTSQVHIIRVSNRVYTYL